MNYYEAWFNLKDTSRDVEFAGHVERFLGYLRGRGMIESYRFTRRKLGFGPPELGEFHLSIEVTDLAQLERAFQRAASRDAEVEPLHAAVFSAIRDVRFALYRDFPDPVRGGRGAAGPPAGAAGPAAGSGT